MNVTPILKKGKKERASPRKYRLIRLTLIPRKVIEQLILENISMHKRDKSVNRNSQHEFTKGNSCLSNLIAFCDEITGLVVEWKGVDIVCLDISKTFDTASHKILIDKLLIYDMAEQ